MLNLFKEQKTSYSISTYFQKHHIAVTVKRKYRKKNKNQPFKVELSSILNEYSKMRRKIAQKSSVRLRLRLYFASDLRLVYSVLFCLAIIVIQHISVFAGAVSIPREARDTAENAKMAAQDVINKEQASQDRINLEEYIHDTELIVSNIEEKLAGVEKTARQKQQEAEKFRIKAQTAAKEAEEAAAQAAKDKAEAAKAAAAVVAADKYAKNIETANKKRIADISVAMEKKLDELDNSGEDVSERQLRAVVNEGLDQLKQIEEEAEATTRAAYKKADHLNKITEMLEAKADRSELIADKKEEAADLANDLAEKAEDEVSSAKEAYENLTVNFFEARADVRSAKSDLENLILEQNKSNKVDYCEAKINYYSWKDSHGNSGYQIVKPFNYGHWQKEYSYGISASHITSRNKSAGESGSVSTFSDITVSFNKRTETEKYIYNYGADVSLPTGKPTLSWSERYAMMNEDLVEVSQFGKGWQFTPRFAVTKKINREDTLTFGTSYSFNGSYDPTSDIPNDTISPGGEWRKNLRWQHAGKDWQFVGELIHTTSSPVKISNGASYPADPSWEQRLTYNRKLNDKEDLMFYYWRQSQVTSEILPNIAKESAINYWGTMWSKKLKNDRVLRLTFDIMKNNGNHYSGITNGWDDFGAPKYTSVTVAGRTKYTVGVIYDIKINEHSNFSAEVQKFIMKDGRSTTGKPPTRYSGFNAFLMYNRSF